MLDVMPPVGELQETDEQRKARLAPPQTPLPPVHPAQQSPVQAPSTTGTTASMPPVQSSPQPAPVPSQAGPAMPPVPQGAPAGMPDTGQSPAMAGAQQPMPPVPQTPQAGPPQLHGWKEALNAIGSISPYAQKIEAQIPGTPQNWNAQQLRQTAQTERQQGIQKTQQELEQEPKTADLNRRNVESEIATRGDKDSSALAKLGLKRDEQGGVVPDEQSPVYKQNQEKEQRAQETEQSLTAYKQSQSDLNEARAVAEKAKADPNSPAYQEAQQKLQMAQQAHSIAAQRLGLDEQQFANKLDRQDDIKPSGQVTSRGSAATSAQQMIDGILPDIKSQAAQLGPIMGRISRGELQIGNADPKVAALYTKLGQLYAIMGAAHGWRNIQVTTEFQKFIGGLERNPAAFEASLQAARQSMDPIVKEGRTTHKAIREDGGGGTGKDYGPAAGKPDGSTGTMNGKKVIVKGGRIVDQ